MNVPPEPSMIREEDARAMVRLLSDVMMMPDDLTAQKTALLSGLAKLVNADAWIWVFTSITNEVPTAMQMLYEGYTQEQMAIFADAAVSPHIEDPTCVHGLKLLDQNQHLTETRHQQFKDDVWNQFPAVQDHFKKMDFDQYVLSIYPLPNPAQANTSESDPAESTPNPETTAITPESRLISGVGMYRKEGRPEFNERERRIIHIITQEARWLHHSGLPDAADEGIPALSPRLKSVLTLLLDGQSPQQIAKGLELSPHTVKDYTKALYRHFKVSTRAELLRRFMAGASNNHKK